MKTVNTKKSVWQDKSQLQQLLRVWNEFIDRYKSQ